MVLSIVLAWFAMICLVFFIDLSMVPAWFSWVGPWVGFLFPVLVYVVGLSVFSCLGPLVFHWCCYCFCLLLLLFLRAFPSLAMVPAPFFTGLSRFHCLLFVMVCHGFVYCFGLVCNVLACYSLFCLWCRLGFHGLVHGLPPFSCVGLCWLVGLSLVSDPLFFLGFA